MRIHRRWSSCAILLAAMSVVSCAEGQFGQVMQNVGKSMAKGMCAEGGGPASAAPEFCLYVTELRLLNHDSEADVSLTIVNRTGRRIYLTVPSWPYLTDSSGAKWNMTKNTGIVYSGYGAPLSLEPNVDSQVSFIFQRQGQVPSDLTFSMRGEVSIAKIDSRGEPVPGQPQLTRGFNFSGIRLAQQEQPPVQPLQQKSSNATMPTGSQGTSLGQNDASIQAGTRAVALPVASLATALPGSKRWESLDIVGLKIGMSSDEFQQRLKTNDVPLEIRVAEAELADVPNTRHISHVIGASKEQNPGVVSKETIAASFAPVPNRSVAGVVGRSRRYPAGQQPTVQNVREALVGKYGPPSIQKNLGSEFLIWVFDKDGNQVAGPGLDDKCHMMTGMLSDISTSGFLFNRQMSQQSAWGVCGRALSVRITLDSNRENNLVVRITSSLIDPFMIEESLAKTDSMVSEYKRKVREKEFEGGQQQGKPKL